MNPFHVGMTMETFPEAVDAQASRMRGLVSSVVM
jgi:hypothetical protein